MDEIVLEERVINKLPAPFNIENTPYLQLDFNDKIKRKCLEESERRRLSNEWLKISKVIIIGDISVGKTCLVNRYCRKFFETNYKSTIGVDFEVVKFHILGIPFLLQIWDTAGQERFKSIAQSYYRGANVIIVAFDLTNCGSLSNCKKWLNEAMDANLGENPFIFLVGTKRDLLNEFSYRNIQCSATKLAKQMKAEYWSVSSKTGKNVNKLFQRIASLSFEDIITKGYESNGNGKCIGNKLSTGENVCAKRRDKKCCSQ